MYTSVYTRPHISMTSEGHASGLAKSASSGPALRSPWGGAVTADGGFGRPHLQPHAGVAAKEQMR